MMLLLCVCFTDSDHVFAVSSFSTLDVIKSFSRQRPVPPVCW